MNGFYWLKLGEIAGSPAPRGQSDIAFWTAAGVRAVLSLTTEPVAIEGVAIRHLPIPDMTAPSIEQLDEARSFLDDCIRRGAPVVVHCAAGKGRTGTVLAAWLIAQGTPASDAIDRIRALSPGSIETVEQEQALIAYATMRH